MHLLNIVFPATKVAPVVIKAENLKILYDKLDGIAISYDIELPNFDFLETKKKDHPITTTQVIECAAYVFSTSKEHITIFDSSKDENLFHLVDTAYQIERKKQELHALERKLAFYRTQADCTITDPKKSKNTEGSGEKIIFPKDAAREKDQLEKHDDIYYDSHNHKRLNLLLSDPEKYFEGAEDWTPLLRGDDSDKTQPPVET